MHNVLGGRPMQQAAPVPSCSGYPRSSQSSSGPVSVSSRASSSTPATSRSSSRAGSRRKSGKAGSSTPRPAPPPILIPDPTGPPPANFLRNQHALLGVAGLVGNVIPAQLAVQKQTRGSTSSNPIIIEDELDPPPIGQKPRCPAIDPAQLPVPSGGDVITSLIRQKNIFPVLESIIRFLGAGNGVPPPSSLHSSSPALPFARPYGTGVASSREIVSQEQPPAKRRRLSTVPAGANDWDVPYPFAAGEGPSEYRANWERERGRQLITQLVTLIKGAVQNAAMRKHIKRTKAKQRRGSSEEQSSAARNASSMATGGLEAAHGRDVQEVQELLDRGDHDTAAEPSGGEAVASSSSGETAGSSGGEPMTPLDHLVASLLAGESGDKTSFPCSGFGESGLTPGSSGGWSTPTTDVSTQDFDQAAFESFLAELEDFSPSLKGLEAGAPTPLTSIVDQSTDSTPNPNESPVIDHPPSTSPLIPPEVNSHTASMPTSGTCTETIPPMNFSISDESIDPALLAISIPPSVQTFTPSFPAASPPPALVQSPITSVSSLAGPLTPRWGSPVAGPGVHSGEQDPLAAASMLLQFASKSSSAPRSGTSPYSALPIIQAVPAANGSSSIQAAQEVTPSAPCRPQSQQPLASTSQKRPSAGAAPDRNNSKTLNKEEIVRRARERRRQLVTEIERAKVELWETSIEGGVLVHLAKESF
ncbi:hypothetical protein BV22DRAFT_76348 [Leucogyrophana mollusca]|uniref:Uncharacterized protein n=1 Tax=Leucogyrophana mollusca TaxID=85980 RepID=A0ACB8BZQ9_9AGAM|nr:hypothetical protein BV22DRAFT_76348 [Leucogyrophana mollusca]